jgi:hypothetical protein
VLHDVLDQRVLCVEDHGSLTPRIPERRLPPYFFSQI